MKIAFVVQRCGEEIIGGAESLCLNLAERLSEFFNIEILTTCAFDYMTWKNHYPDGTVYIKGVKVTRFKTDFERDVNEFNLFSNKMLTDSCTQDDESRWMKMQGPYSSELFQFIENNKNNYDLFVFFTYLYATTFYGISRVWSKSILIPQAHDELPLKLSVYNDVFQKTRGIIFQTREEQELIEKRFDLSDVKIELIGQGVNNLEEIPPDFSKWNLNFPYIFYLGRIDRSKGCDELVDYFIRFKQDNNSNLKLVLAGSKVFDIKEGSDIIYLGILDEKEKTYVLKNSLVFVMPSRYESFSISTMEAWLSKKPVIVNAKSEVLKAHCKRSNGGLYYDNYEEFSKCLGFILNNKDICISLGKNGFDYVIKNYTWDKIVNKYRDFLETMVETKI